MTALAVLCIAAALALLPAAAGPLARIRRTDAGTEVASLPALDPHSVATTFDIMAACMRGGLPAGTAAAAVAASAPVTVGHALRTTADLLSLGADPDSAWEPVAAVPEIEPLARMARRSARSGASLADAVAELAESERTRAEDVAAAAAERAGVLISGPLGLCFLPAFVCLGIVPVVIGLARTALGGGI